LICWWFFRPAARIRLSSFALNAPSAGICYGRPAVDAFQPIVQFGAGAAISPRFALRSVLGAFAYRNMGFAIAHQQRAGRHIAEPAGFGVIDQHFLQLEQFRRGPGTVCVLAPDLNGDGLADLVLIK